MKITQEPLENRQLRLTVELDAERARQSMQRAARKISKQVNIPGFRKGKAPYNLIVQHYGEDAIRQEAISELTPKVFTEAMAEENIETYALNTLKEATWDPLTFEFIVPLPPKIDLGEYRDYRLPSPEVKISKEEVQQKLQEIRRQNTILNHVERPVELGDGATINLSGYVEGKPFIQKEDILVLLDSQEDQVAPGFSEAIVGMTAGEDRTFTLPLPDDFSPEELQGQRARFTVKVTEVHDSLLPDLDDDLARTVGNFDSLEELQEHTQEQLLQAAQQKADDEYADQVLKALVEQARVEYPPVILENMLEDTIQDLEQEVKHKARLPLEDYLRLQGKSMEEIREELKLQAIDRIRYSLALGKVVELEGIEVDEEEIDARIEETIAEWGDQADDVRQALNSSESRDKIRNHLLTNQARQRLISIAKGKAPDLASADDQEDETPAAETEI